MWDMPIVQGPLLFLALLTQQGPPPSEVAPAQQPGGEPARPQAAAPAGLPEDSPESRAVQKLVADFVAAYNTRDAQAIASQFTEDGTIVGLDGSVTRGREAIEARYREAFEDLPEAQIRVESESVRLLAPDVLLEEGQAAIHAADRAAVSGRYHAIYVRRDGRWLQSSVYDLPEAPAADDPTLRLEELAWLLGEWVNEGDGTVVHTNCRWDQSRAFLIREFEMQLAGRGLLSGTQRIGWDPTLGQFRSWVFDSEGGFSEGRWSRDGDGWIIKSEGFVPDGRTVTATSFVTPVSKDRILWSTVDRTLGDEAILDDAEVVLVRKPPQPGTSPDPEERP